MTLIKLSYLQQAMELTITDSGISKKKLTDNAKPVAFRALTIRRYKEEPLVMPVIPEAEAATLVIEKEKENYF